jgi:hypothetical protein
MSENGALSPSQWWKDHAKQFSNVSFLVRQFFGIPNSQIEIEWIFNMAEILTNLH